MLTHHHHYQYHHHHHTTISRIVSHTPGSLPCGHIFCLSCINRMMMFKPTTTEVIQTNKNAVKSTEMKLLNGAIEAVKGSVEGGDYMSVLSSNRNNNTTNNNTNNNHNHHHKDRGAIETSTAAEFCRHCPVCTTTLSDWSVTLNKIDADSALLSSLQKTSSNKHTLSR